MAEGLPGVSGWRPAVSPSLGPASHYFRYGGSRRVTQATWAGAAHPRPTSGPPWGAGAASIPGAWPAASQMGWRPGGGGPVFTEGWDWAGCAPPSAPAQGWPCRAWVPEPPEHEGGQAQGALGGLAPPAWHGWAVPPLSLPIAVPRHTRLLPALARLLLGPKATCCSWRR